MTSYGIIYVHTCLCTLCIIKRAVLKFPVKTKSSFYSSLAGNKHILERSRSTAIPNSKKYKWFAFYLMIRWTKLVNFWVWFVFSILFVVKVAYKLSLFSSVVSFLWLVYFIFSAIHNWLKSFLTQHSDLHVPLFSELFLCFFSSNKIRKT